MFVDRIKVGRNFKLFSAFIYPVFIYTPWYGSMTLEYRAAWKKGRKLPAAQLRVCGFLSSSTAATVNVV